MTLEKLLGRRSMVAAKLQEPGPTPEQVDDILRAAIRVPDHKALAPWRFILFSGDARAAFGQKLADIHAEGVEGEERERQLQSERNRFLRAPLVICVVASPKESTKVPQIEQLLSAGAACQNILHAAAALGFKGQWLTEWLAYDAKVHKLLGLEGEEAVAGFIYIGSSDEQPMERPRVQPSDVASHWQA